MNVLIMKKMFPYSLYVGILRKSMCTAPGPKNSTGGGSMSPKYKPSDFQKFILVWTKKYKSKQDVPDLVSHEIIERSRSEARIKISNVLMLLTVLGSIVAIISGKAAAKRGQSVHQMNLDWHKKYEEEHAKSTESKQ